MILHGPILFAQQWTRNIVTDHIENTNGGNVVIKGTSNLALFGQVLSYYPKSATPLGGEFLGSNGWWGFRTGPDGAFNLDINNSGTPTSAFTINQSGFVGIGTQPRAPFEIFTNTPTASSFSSQRWSTINSGYYLTLKTISSSDWLNFNFVQTIGGAEHNSLSFFKGDVGIGTEKPDAKLAVKGDIHAREVRVDMNGAMVPDYVFEKNYNLLTLAEVETYINQNKHLPEIRAAKEMEQNGVNLGEMNMLLLKKLEELTLHVIELKKENEKQQKEIEDLRKK